MSIANDHLSQGLVPVSVEIEELNCFVDCWFEFEPACRGAREYGTGLQLEPDYPATMTLVHVYLPGSNVDIAPVLSDGVIEGLETMATDMAAQGDRDDY